MAFLGPGITVVELFDGVAGGDSGMVLSADTAVALLLSSDLLIDVSVFALSK